MRTSSTRIVRAPPLSAYARASLVHFARRRLSSRAIRVSVRKLPAEIVLVGACAGASKLHDPAGDPAGFHPPEGRYPAESRPRSQKVIKQIYLARKHPTISHRNAVMFFKGEKVERNSPNRCLSSSQKSRRARVNYFKYVWASQSSLAKKDLPPRAHSLRHRGRARIPMHSRAHAQRQLQLLELELTGRGRAAPPWLQLCKDQPMISEAGWAQRREGHAEPPCAAPPWAGACAPTSRRLGAVGCRPTGSLRCAPPSCDRRPPAAAARRRRRRRALSVAVPPCPACPCHRHTRRVSAAAAATALLALR